MASTDRSPLRVGFADHFGWSVVVSATGDGTVVDRRRIELVEPGIRADPVHHGIDDLDDAEAEALVATVRASAQRATAAALAELAEDLPRPVGAVAVRSWPADFPTEIAVVRQVPWEARADGVMYRQVLAEAATARGWAVHTYDHRHAEAEATARLGERAHAVLHGPREHLGAPWAKDHRTALAATLLIP